jgi:hypothetical protein
VKRTVTGFGAAGLLLAVSQATAQPSVPPGRSDDALPAMALDSNMGDRVTDLLACRLDIAVQRRVPVAGVVAGEVLLRWTVRPDGAVDDPDLVALRATDPEVLACIKHKVTGWSFVRARGDAPVRLEHHLDFL